MWRRALVLVGVAAGCGGDEKASAPTRAWQAPTGDDAARRSLMVTTVDDDRRIVATVAMVEIALDAAAGAYVAEHGGDGLRLRAVPPGSMLAGIGLVDGDLVENVAGVTLRDATDLDEAWRVLSVAGDATVRLERRGERRELRIYLRESVDHVLDPSSRADPDDEVLSRALATGVRKTGPTAYDVDPRVLDAVARHNARNAGRLMLRDGEIQRGSSFEVLGLGHWDRITAINGRPFDPTALVSLSDPAEEVTIDVVRLRDPITFRYRAVEGLVDAARLDAALAALAADPPPLPLPDTSTTTTAPDLDLSWIEKIDDENYRLTRAGVDQLLANPMAAAKGARITPSIKNGKPNGIKLYAIRPSSVYAKLGFSNGDTITAINGHPLDSLDKGLEVYQKVRDARVVEVDGIRRGRPFRLTFQITP